MDCESFGKYLDNYESLTEQEKSDMDEHAAKCEECRAELVDDFDREVSPESRAAFRFHG